MKLYTFTYKFISNLHYKNEIASSSPLPIKVVHYKMHILHLMVLRTKPSVLSQSYKGDGFFEDAKSAFEFKATRPETTNSLDYVSFTYLSSASTPSPTSAT
jgi:hypothetical protein